MLLANGDGTYTGGAFDVLCILHNVETDTYHAAIFLERPMPGPVLSVENTKIVRLMSKGHHTEGAPTLEEAQKHLDEFAEKIKVPEENIWREPRPWDGSLGIIWVEPNWKAA